MDYFNEQFKKYEYKVMKEAIGRVRELHKPDKETGECTECIKGWREDVKEWEFEKYPCPTIKALDGGEKE